MVPKLDLKQIFLQDIPLMDVRAPIEFRKGGFPSSSNIPLLDDTQRALVGTAYKQKGESAAVELGWTLATDEVRSQRIAAWSEFVQKHPHGFLYCARGGLRSRVTQKLLADSGVDYPLVLGGYRALRKFLLNELEQICSQRTLLLIGGKTGCGKTSLLSLLPGSIDLEGLANHKGSTFGNQLTPQPAQAWFENQLAISAIKSNEHFGGYLILENEGKLIGRLFIPLFLYQRMELASVAVLETSMEDRVNNILEDYVGSSVIESYAAMYGANWAQSFEEQLLFRLSKIQKRLGATRYEQVHGELVLAIKEFVGSNKRDRFKTVIEELLREYYDPMYDYQSQKHQDRVVFRGTSNQIVEWLRGGSA